MDNRQFMKLFLKSEDFLRAYLQSVTGDVDAADDLLQNVSVLLMETFDRYDPDRPFRAWALGIARMEVLKWRKRQGDSRLVLSEQTINAMTDTGMEFAESSDERISHLRACLDSLSRYARRLVELRYLEDLSIRAVARRVGRKEGAVEMALVRARRALRDCIDRKLSRIAGA